MNNNVETLGFEFALSRQKNRAKQRTTKRSIEIRFTSKDKTREVIAL